MNRILKKLVPGVLAAALALGAVPSGITFDDIKASAAEVPTTRRVTNIGGSIGTQINIKFYFHVDNNDDQVQYIRIHDPDVADDVTVTYARQDWKTNGTMAGDYVVEIPVYPKNMDKSASIEMLDSSKKTLKFYQGESGTTNKSKYTTNVKSYLEGIQKTIDNDQVGYTSWDIKSNATDLEKATWDLCNALMNYGDWSKAYFYHRSDFSQQPANGRFDEEYLYNDSFNDNIDGHHPNYPSWWDDIEAKQVEDPDKPGETKTVYHHKYWKSLPDSETRQTFNELLDQTAYICNVSYQNNADDKIVNSAIDDKGAYKTWHGYSLKLVLDDMVKIRVVNTACNDVSASMSIGSENAATSQEVHKELTKSTHQEQPLYAIYVDSEPLSFSALSTNHYFYFDNVCPCKDEDGELLFKESDKVMVSVMGFARIANNKRKEEF